jgi:hypothetical protein
MRAASTVRLPGRFVVGSGPTYALVFGGRGWLFRAWSELEEWRGRFGLEPAELHVRKFSSVDEAEAWLRASGIGSFGSWRYEEGREAIGAESREAIGVQTCPASPSARRPFVPPASPMHRISRTPAELARRVADDPALGLGVPGAREEGGAAGRAGSETLPSGREALRRALGGADLPEHAELRVPGGVKDYPSFGFALTLPGNVIYAEAKNLLLRPAVHGVRSARGRLAAVLLEALNSDLGKLAVAVRVNTMVLYNALRKHVPSWRANGGRDAKKKPVEDFELLDALEALIKSRGLALRVSEDAVGRVESARGERDGMSGRQAAGEGGSGRAAAGAGSGSAATAT